MSAPRPRFAIQCPAFRRALSFGLVLLALAACGYIPRAVEGVPPGAPWEALPLRKWLAEGRAEPQALAFCAPPECRPGLVVSVIDLSDKDADISEAILRDPARLARALTSGTPRDRKIRTLVSSSPITASEAKGFAISLSRSDGTRPAFGAALGRRSGASLRVVLVIGDDEAAVLSTVRQVAVRELGA
ncbi:hypothetical protein [Microvirga antarctica]|uniref:hypothetical protein n=1 Tax=Microvirga antarctica TaxID=2819233 RepID=UPI001B311BC0|nr:hypothetical protein [Microvirga antarctica]